jgi:hypothetical protein
MLQALRSRLRDRIRWIILSMYLILPAILSPGAYLASSRKEYQRQIKIFLWSNRCVWVTLPPPSVNRFLRQCELLNISQSYEPPRPVKGMRYFKHNFSWTRIPVTQIQYQYGVQFLFKILSTVYHVFICINSTLRSVTYDENNFKQHVYIRTECTYD